MRSDQQRAAQLWRDLLDCSERAIDEPNEGLNPAEVGFIMHEFAIGLIAAGSEKEVIMTYLANRIGDIGRDELAITNVIFGRSCPKGPDRDHSDIGFYSGRHKSHPRWRDEQFRHFRELHRAG